MRALCAAKGLVHGPGKVVRGRRQLRLLPSQGNEVAVVELDAGGENWRKHDMFNSLLNVRYYCLPLLCLPSRPDVEAKASAILKCLTSSCLGNSAKLCSYLFCRSGTDRHHSADATPPAASHAARARPTRRARRATRGGADIMPQSRKPRALRNNTCVGSSQRQTRGYGASRRRPNRA